MNDDRREQPRSRSSLPCKLYLPDRGRYVAGTTGDISKTGALIRIAGSTPLKVGQRVVVGIAAPDCPGLLRHDRMRQAVVMRIKRETDELAAVALQFTEAFAEAPAPTRRAA
jgi:c-di-GMP-binding flagellar brake protein YcgR